MPISEELRNSQPEPQGSKEQLLRVPEVFDLFRTELLPPIRDHIASEDPVLLSDAKFGRIQLEASFGLSALRDVYRQMSTQLKGSGKREIEKPLKGVGREGKLALIRGHQGDMLSSFTRPKDATDSAGYREMTYIIDRQGDELIEVRYMPEERKTYHVGVTFRKDRAELFYSIEENMFNEQPYLEEVGRNNRSTECVIVYGANGIIEGVAAKTSSNVYQKQASTENA